jgi:hypothetical protein
MGFSLAGCDSLNLVNCCLLASSFLARAAAESKVKLSEAELDLVEDFELVLSRFGSEEKTRPGLEP